MNKSIKIISVIFLLFSLVSCAGTGSKSLSSVSTYLDEGGSGKVFISRESNFYASAVLFTVTLNGQQIAKLGSGELVSDSSNVGTNYLKISVEGFQGIGIKDASISYQGDSSKDNFFIISIKPNLFGAELKLIETTESTWKSESG